MTLALGVGAALQLPALLPAPHDSLELRWQYSRAGNIRWTSEAGRYAYSDPTNPQGVTSIPGIAYRFDSDGNVIRKGADTVLYDWEGRMKAYNEVPFTYDHTEMRVTKGRTVYLGRLAEERPGEGTTYNIFHGTQLVCQVNPGQRARQFYIPDHLGGTAVVLDETGYESAKAEYRPYGQAQQTGTMTYGFTGKERDTETGLHYFGARYYDSNLGRWTSKDSAFLSQDLSHPEAINLYAYAQNNPVGWRDVDGRESEPVTLILMGNSIDDAYRRTSRLFDYWTVTDLKRDYRVVPTGVFKEGLGKLVDTQEALAAQGRPSNKVYVNSHGNPSGAIRLESSDFVGRVPIYTVEQLFQEPEWGKMIALAAAGGAEEFHVTLVMCLVGGNDKMMTSAVRALFAQAEGTAIQRVRITAYTRTITAYDPLRWPEGNPNYWVLSQFVPTGDSPTSQLLDEENSPSSVDYVMEKGSASR
jgi:RHS repeat-associated protein